MFNYRRRWILNPRPSEQLKAVANIFLLSSTQYLQELVKKNETNLGLISL